MKNLTEQDVGRWIIYINGVGETQRGKIKSFNNDRRVAWVVYNCDNKMML